MNYEAKEAAWRKKKATAREAAAGKTMLIDAGDADTGSRIVADLKAQFRCGGCAEYLDWINYLFGFSTEMPEYWGDQYNFSIVDTPYDLEKTVTEKKDQFERNRLLAGFCWKWSDSNPDGSLVPDVVIDDWKRPWNAKAIQGKKYQPEKHPYTLWAETPAGEEQIGCIYSAQGF